MYSTVTGFDYLSAVDLVFVRRYLQNIRSHPGEEKYRRIRTSNKAFQVVQHIQCIHTYVCINISRYQGNQVISGVL